MKGSLTLLIFTLWGLKLFSQADTTSGYVKPEFKGGQKAFHSYLDNYLRYPPGERKNGNEGNVTALIYVDSNGNIKDVTTTGKNEVFNKEAKRVLMLMPAWSSGKLNGVAIDTTASKEIYFSLENSRTKNDSSIYECLNYHVRLDSGSKEEKAKRKEAAEKYEAAKSLYDKGVSELQNKNAAGALDLLYQADQQGFHGIDLYYNRGVANFKVGNKEAGCQDWLEGARRGDTEALDLYNKKCK
jgi:hypothetical protein